MTGYWRTALAVCVAAPWLCGCALEDDPPRAPHLASKACETVAEARMNDARVNGHGVRDQQIVFRGSYADCVRWEAKGYRTEVP